MADEVGLGKTIEAGLVMCQYWAERRRKLLVICPASLRKQWALELEEKFNLPTVVLESRSYSQCIAGGNPTPFDTDNVVIISFHFANRMREQIRLLRWDLAVIDEAHKLRNVFRSTNKIGRGIKWSLDETRKLLLTATPLQNSLLELYGLALLIDDRFFGNLASFRSRFTTVGADMDELKNRLRSFCHELLEDKFSLFSGVFGSSDEVLGSIESGVDFEKALLDTKAQLKALKRQARRATTTDEQHTLQLNIRELEQKQRRQRQEIFDAEDEIQDKRDALISALERRLKQSTTTDTLFTIRWSVT